MDTKFNEQQAFENLQAILNHMYTIANKFYSEMQSAQNLNREKDKIITDLNQEHAETLATLKNSFEDELANCRTEISTLNKKLAEQEKKFTEHLGEYGNYNVNLTARLKKYETELQNKIRGVKEREESLLSREQTLKEDREKFKADCATFEQEKSSAQNKLNAYESFREQANDFDTERQKLHDTYSRQIAELKKQNQAAQDKIKQLEQENKKLAETVQNYLSQIDNLNKQIADTKNSFMNFDEPDYLSPQGY